MDSVMPITQAVILAGGRGERLRPLTDTIPKPMAPVCGRPFLEHLVELLKKNGITDIVMLTGYLSEKITEHFGDGSRFNVRIQYSVGSAEDETGTRLRNAASLLNEKFLLLYSDNYWPLKLPSMAKFYQSMGTLAMTTVYTNADGFGEYGFENNVFVRDDGFVARYDKTRKDPELNGVDIGFFILDKKALSYIPRRNVSFEKEVLPKLIAEKELCGFKTNERYQTITTQEKIKDTESFLA